MGEVPDASVSPAKARNTRTAEGKQIARQPLPAAETAAFAATPNVAGDSDNDGQATALFPRADRKNRTCATSFSDTSVA